MSASSLYILLYSAGLKKSSIERFLVLFDSQWMVFGSKLIPKHVKEPPNIYKQLLFWMYCCVLFFFKLSRLAGWVAGRLAWWLGGWHGGWLGGWVAGWLKNPILMKTQSSAQTWTWTLDFDKNSITVKYSQCWCKPLQCVYSHILRFKNMIVYMIFLHTIIAPKERNFVLVGVGVRLKRFF